VALLREHVRIRRIECQRALEVLRRAGEVVVADIAI
jgi:hypothetical protein